MEDEFKEYKRLFLHELKQHGLRLNVIQASLNSINLELARLKVRAGVWGALAGIVPGIIAVAYTIFKVKQ